MPNIVNENINPKDKYIDRSTWDLIREQRGKDNKDTFLYASVIIAAVAVYATWAWMIVQKIKA